MIEGMYLATLIGTILVLLAAFSSLLAFRFGAPLLLLFLGIGLLAGEDGFGIDFDNAAMAYYIGSLALAVILFDSGFGTPIHHFRQAAGPALTLATVGVLLTTVLFAAAAQYMLDLTWLQGLLLGAIVASTDAAAVFFLIRIGDTNIRDRVRSTLEVESGTNDPVAILLTVALVETIAAGASVEEVGLSVALHLAREIGIGLILGLAGGFAIVAMVNRLQMDRGLTPIFVLALALLLFALTGSVGGSGFLAVYVAGLLAGNRGIKAQATLKRFNDGMTWLAQIIMFLVLGLLATPSEFGAIALPAVVLALFLIFVARPIAVWLCLLPFDYERAEGAFISWVGLRGAVSILLAIVPMIGGLEDGRLFFNVAFIIVLVSLVVQGWTINPMARLLGLIVPKQIGPVDKVELELPGTANHELLAYRVVPDSPVARGERVPRWARPSLVIRDGQSMRYQYAGRLKAGDYVYLFISPRYPRLLDRLFASRAPVAVDDSEFFGAFTVDPSRPARELVAAYDAVVEPEWRDRTISDMIIGRLGGRAEYADRVALGPVELIVRDVSDAGRVIAAGVSLEPETTRVRVPLFVGRRDIASKLRAWLSARRRNARNAANDFAGNGEPPTPGGHDAT